ncbi:MAG: phosphoribosyl-ATP diphosphatase [Chloroflexi bacterium]|nr:phosphoribosyl-ATP diphosphatase [Chloroflexota bacterium]MDE2861932.1 phosphoribosyl-ATP diphosphatase [Chloroflexota bacterium]MDE2936692.1 phosphoribosyl-ATP diphosphatase [Chloroflexota bacterium]MXW27681.1 phosphoribosyl-ATP diphosphatase [Chloroflexota bacterium]MXY00304.1 phosphoribosyl-ATP diphosphatase [Chloroflexota bacterium]
MSERPGVEIIDQVIAVIAQRQKEMPPDSYVAECLRRGWPYIARKLIEEATEASIAAREESDERLASEISDLIFFALVALAHRGVDAEKVWAELSLRRR